jgi:hypothetical protein
VICVLHMNPSSVTPWGSNWACSTPLIVVMVVFHAYALGLLNRAVSSILKGNRTTNLDDMASVFVVAALHFAPRSCKVLRHRYGPSPIVCSGFFPTARAPCRFARCHGDLGNTTFRLESRWLMGSLEALNRWILFGLTTAFLVTVIDEVWFLRKLPGQHDVR